MAELMFGVEARRGLLVLTGEAGTGKTTLMRHFLQWLTTRHFSSAYIFHAHLDPRDLYEFILRDFGVPVESTRKSELLVSLHRWLLLRQTAGDSPVMVIDEAQALSLRTLNELTSMLNLENSGGKLLQIVLAGQPELDEKLRQPESRALRQRIMVRCRLPLLTVDETGEYIESRLRGAGSSLAASTQIFPRQTVETIYSFARGIPRVVNLLCEHGLVGAYADHRTTVCPQNIRRAAAEFDLVGAPFSPVQSHLVLREPAALTEIAPIPLDEAPPAARTGEVVAAAAWEESPAVVECTATADVVRPPLEVITVTAAFEALGEPAESRVEESAAPPSESVAAAALIEELPGVQSKDVEDLAEPPLEPGTAAASVEELSVADDCKGEEDVAAATSELVAAAAFFEALPAPAELEAQPSSDSARDVAPRIATVAAAREATPKQPTTRTVVSQPRTYAWRRHREITAFQRYWQEVASSFIRDWRQLFRSVVPQTVTIPAFSSFGGESIRQKVMEPLRGWLAKPFNFRSTPRTKRHPLSADKNSRGK